MTYFAHEEIRTVNFHGNKRIQFTGDHAIFLTRKKALESAAILNNVYNVNLDVYALTSQELDQI